MLKVTNCLNVYVNKHNENSCLNIYFIYTKTLKKIEDTIFIDPK